MSVGENTIMQNRRGAKVATKQLIPKYIPLKL